MKALFFALLFPLALKAQKDGVIYDSTMWWKLNEVYQPYLPIHGNDRRQFIAPDFDLSVSGHLEFSYKDFCDHVDDLVYHVYTPGYASDVQDAIARSRFWRIMDSIPSRVPSQRHILGVSYIEKCGCKPPVYECKLCGKMKYAGDLLPMGCEGESGYKRLSDSLKRLRIDVDTFLFARWDELCKIK